jgi:C4-type Zn-finger protein
MDALRIEHRTIRAKCPTCGQETDAIDVSTDGKIMPHERDVVIETVGPFVFATKKVRCRGSGKQLPALSVSCEACGFSDEAFGDEDAGDVQDYHSDMHPECQETAEVKPYG